MSTRYHYKSARVASGESEARKHTVVLYSPDIDFCMSLSMFFQDMYKIITTTDPEMMLEIVKGYQPDLAIVDASPSDRMNHRFEIMKREDDRLRIMLLHVPRVEGPPLHLQRTPHVDAMLSHPIDLTDVMEQVDFLLHSEARGNEYGIQSD